MTVPDKKGYYGNYGGRFVPETLIPVLKELEEAYHKFNKQPEQQAKLRWNLRYYAGRPTPLYYAERLSKEMSGAKIYLKREDLLHTGAHKINNTIGQILLADFMNKNRIIAETGAGQHGVAAATVAAKFKKQCVVFMGAEDMHRQSLNVFKMRLLGAEVREVTSGSKTLKEATSEAIRDWVANADNSYYLIGSTVGPHPYPMIVRNFQSVIGKEVKRQISRLGIRNVTHLFAAVGGGSNSIGLFYPFLADSTIKKIGVEAAGFGLDTGKHAATLACGKPGVLHGSLSYVLQNIDGQILNAYSISAGLDYPGVGPEHSFLKETRQVFYTSVTDSEAMNALKLLTLCEGIIPALESAHALAAALPIAKQLSSEKAIIVNISGRGDKDIGIISEYYDQNKKEIE